jgi:hypothetical protein
LIRRISVIAAGLLAAASAAACAGLLGIDPVTFDPEGGIGDGSTGDATDGGASGDATPLDAALEASLVDAPLPDASCVPCSDAGADPCGIVCDAPTASQFLEVGNGFVFFGSRKKIERVGLDGLGRITIATDATGEIGGFAFHRATSTIAWTVPSADAIHLRAGNGTDADRPFSVPPHGLQHATHVVLTSTKLVYFEANDAVPGGGAGIACTIADANCIPATTVFSGNPAEEVVAVAQGDTYLGWRTRGVGSDAGSAYIVTTASPEASMRKLAGVSTMDFMPVTVDEAGFVYWTELGGTSTNIFKGTVNKVFVLNTGSERVASLAVGGAGIHLTEPGAQPTDYAGKILRVSGGSALYSQRPNPGRIVQDVNGIYWIDRGNPPQTLSLVMRGKP